MSELAGIKVGAEIVGLDRIYKLVEDLQKIDQNKAIKAGLGKGANVFLRLGRQNLRARNDEHTGNLLKSMRVRVAKKGLASYAGFSMVYNRMVTDGYGSHSWLVDRGTVQRFTKDGRNRGIMPASYFWTDARREGGAMAIREIERGIIDAVNKLQR